MVTIINGGSMKKETVEEFLARGGKITVVPIGASAKDPQPTQPAQTIHSSKSGPATIMSYGEADLFYGEGKPKKARKKKAQASIDINALPEAIRNKYCKGIGDEDI